MCQKTGPSFLSAGNRYIFLLLFVNFVFYYLTSIIFGNIIFSKLFTYRKEEGYEETFYRFL